MFKQINNYCLIAALTLDIYKRNPRKRGEKSEQARKQVEDAASSIADKVCCACTAA